MIRRPPRSTLSSSSAASDVYKRQTQRRRRAVRGGAWPHPPGTPDAHDLSLIHISEPTRLLSISYAVFRLKKKKRAIRGSGRSRPGEPPSASPSASKCHG